MSIPVPDPLPLRSIPVPLEVTEVTGCDCGGLELHRDYCTIWSLPESDRRGAVDAAQDRLKDYTAALNARLLCQCTHFEVSCSSRMTQEDLLCDVCRTGCGVVWYGAPPAKPASAPHHPPLNFPGQPKSATGAPGT